MSPLRNARYTAEDYWNLPESTRAELINGELWNLASPNRAHQEIVYEFGRHLGDFIRSNGKSCKVYPAPFAVNLFGDESTFVEPDVSLVCDRAKLSDRGCEGAPDLVMEVVSPSSTSMDYLTKLALYREAGVREYWICDPIKRRVLVYAFESDVVLSIYPFSAPVSSILLDGFEICFADIISRM